MSYQKRFRNELCQVLSQIKGRECWSVVAGVGTTVSLDFGAKVRRPKPLANPNLTEEQRLYRPEFSLMVYSSWRLDCENRVICSSYWQGTDVSGPGLGVRRLVGTRLTGFFVARPAYDLVLRFSGQLVFRVFCDQLTDEYNDSNYVLHAPDRNLDVGISSHGVVLNKSNSSNSVW